MVLSMKEGKTAVDVPGMNDAVSKLMLSNSTLLREVSDALCKRQIKSVKKRSTGGGDVVALPEKVADELFLKPDEQAVLKAASLYAWALYTKVPVQGIHKLISYGFCIHCDEVPRAGYYIWTCMGSSGKNDETSGRLELHDAPATEVSHEMGRLRSLVLSQLKALPAPAMVTICRSSRDGYIPKELWRQVEDGVLEIIHALSQEWPQSIEMKYDRDCFWGSSSTPGRAVLPIKEFLQDQGLKTDGVLSQGLKTDGYYFSKVL